MQKKHLHIIIIAIILILLGTTLATHGNRYYGTASLIDIPKNSESFPSSPDFLKDFNIFQSIKSEEKLIEAYRKAIETETGPYAEDMPALLSYIHRVKSNAQLETFFPLLPVYPEHNPATYGNILAYLFPSENNPLLYAQATGYVEENTIPGQYLSPQQFINLMGRVYLAREEEATESFEKLGIITDIKHWSSRDPNGLPLLEALKVIINIRNHLEFKSIAASKQQYQQKLLSLEKESLKISTNSIQAILRAITASSDIHDALFNRLSRKLETQYGEPLTSKTVKTALQLSHIDSPVFELPEKTNLGDCWHDLYHKTYFGPIAKTGSKGARFVCKRVTIEFPANSYILNMFSLPNIYPYGSTKVAEAAIIKSEVMRSLKNSLIVDDNGERMLRIIYRPDMPPQSRAASLAVTDHDFNEIIGRHKSYQVSNGETVWVLYLQPRSISGDHYISFDPDRPANL